MKETIRIYYRIWCEEERRGQGAESPEKFSKPRPFTLGKNVSPNNEFAKGDKEF